MLGGGQKELLNTLLGGGGGGGGGSRFKLPGPSDLEGGATMLHTFLYFPVVSLSADCTN